MAIRLFRLSCVVFMFLAIDVLPCAAKPAVKKPPTKVPVTLQGTVQSISNGDIVMLVDAKKSKGKNPPKGQWTVTSQSDTTLQVTGEAKPDFLHNGLTIQFHASVAGAQVQEKIDTLAIVSSSKTVKTGVFADDPSALKSSKGQSVADVPVEGSQASKVVGRLGRVQGDKWPVHAGGRTLSITLSDSVKITVSCSDPRLISSGDKITVKGKMIKGKSGTCLADEVQVTMGQPLHASAKALKAAAAAKSLAAARGKLEANDDKPEAEDDKPAKSSSENDEPPAKE